MEKIRNQEDFGAVMYGQSDILRKNVFVFTMQADDMGDKDYQHENVYYCVCQVVYYLVKLKKKAKSKLESDKTTFDFYRCPKAYILMTRHPFFNLHIDLLNQIYLIYRIEHLEKSKLITMQTHGEDNSINSMDVSFSTQVNTDKTSWVDMPDIVSAVGQFVDILIDIKIDWIL